MRFKTKDTRSLDDIVYASRKSLQRDSHPDLLQRALMAVKERDEAHEKMEQERLEVLSAIANDVIMKKLELEPISWVKIAYNQVRSSRPVAGGVYLVCHEKAPYNGSQLYGTGGQKDDTYQIRSLIDFADTAEKIVPGRWDDG